MRDKKMFISAILITTVMLFVGGCGRQVEPVSAEPTETINEVYPEESLKPIPSPTALLEESMENSEDEHNSENGVNVEEIIDEDEVIIEDENVGEEAEPVKTEAPKTDTDGSKTNGFTNSGASSGSTNSGTSSGSTTNKPADPTPSPAPAPTPTHTHNWKEHTVTEQVWVPNIVVVDDYEERVVGRTDDEFVCDCGFKTTNRDTIADHIKSNVIAGNDGHGGFFIYEGHNIVEEVKVGSHEEDRGHNETQTYVDYYYCDCGATKK